MTDDFYMLLGVPEDASKTDIRAAFRHKVQEYHPDHNDDPRATAQFTALKMAYDTLKDEDERQAYDRLGHEEYVAERLDGLPAPEQWPSTGESTDSGDSGSGSHSRSTSTSTGTARGSTTSSQQTTTSSGHKSQQQTQSNTSSGTRTTTDGGGAAAARATSHNRSRSTSSANRADNSRLLAWLLQNNTVQWLVGWRLLYLSVLVYVAGIAAYAADQRTALMDAFDRLRSTGDLLASRGELVSMGEFLLDGLSTVSPAALLFAVGILCYPAVVFVLVSITRRTPGWRPTLLYVAAALAPLFGILAAVIAETTVPFVVDLAVFLVLPLGAFLTMLFSANIRPMLVKRLGLDG